MTNLQQRCEELEQEIREHEKVSVNCSDYLFLIDRYQSLHEVMKQLLEQAEKERDIFKRMAEGELKTTLVDELEQERKEKEWLACKCSQLYRLGMTGSPLSNKDDEANSPSHWLQQAREAVESEV